MVPEGSDVAQAARRYVPTINIAQSPPLALPAGFFGLGWLAFAAAALGLVRVAPWVAAGDVGALPVVAVVHTFTLGFLAATMAGVLAQWIPVVFDVPPAPAWLTAGQLGVLAAGTAAWIGGLWTGNGAGMLTGRALDAAALLAVAVAAADRMRRSTRRPDTISAAVGLALVGMTATWIVGGTLGWSLYTGRPDAARLLPLHVATVLVGWIGSLVVGVELKLVPMFAMARTDGIRVAWPLGGLWAGLVADWAGLGRPPLATVAAGLWLLAAVAAFGQMARIMGRGQAPWRDGVLAAVLVGWGLGMAAAAAAVAGAGGAAVVLALVAAAVFITGYQTRIVPFVVARSIGARVGMPPGATFFLARALGSPQGPLAAAGFGLATAAALVTGLATARAGWVAAAGWLLLAWIAGHAGQVLLALVRGRRRPSAAPELLSQVTRPSPP